MKKNILHFYLLAVVLFAASAFTACSNNDEQASVLPVNTYTITVNATKGDDASLAPSNRALVLDDTKLNATWAAGEQVTVYNVTRSTELTGNLIAQSDGASTTLSGTLTGSVDVGDKLTLKFLSPNYTSQEGTLDYIADNCDYATATVTVSSIDGGNITTTSANFINQQAIVKFSLLNGTSPLSASPLVVTADGTSYTVTPASATDVLYVAIPGFSSKNVALAATVGSDTYTYAKTGVTFENGKYYAVSVKMSLKTLANATTDDIGKVVDINGKIINSTTGAAAMIAYISSPGHGLAIALTDDENAYFSKAPEKAAAHTPKVALGTWKLPSKEDWQNMFLACKKDGDTESVTNEMKVAGFRTKVNSAGTSIDDKYYWSSTSSGSNYYVVYFNSTDWANISSQSNDSYHVRAVLEF